MNLDIEGRFNFGRPPQRFFENRSLDGELVGIVGVLVMTPAASLKVWTGRLIATLRRLDHLIKTRPRESRLLLGEGGGGRNGAIEDARAARGGRR